MWPCNGIGTAMLHYVGESWCSNSSVILEKEIHCILLERPPQGDICPHGHKPQGHLKSLPAICIVQFHVDSCRQIRPGKRIWIQWALLLTPPSLGTIHHLINLFHFLPALPVLFIIIIIININSIYISFFNYKFSNSLQNKSGN